MWPNSEAWVTASNVSSRCYKDSMSYDKAGEIILAGMGTQFDPTLQKYFMDCEAKLREYYRTVEH